jgi:hypothetical protein
MYIYQITDCHIKNEEPFFRAGVALDHYIIDLLVKETEPFIFLDSGDRFHVSKETGRVNNKVASFFLRLAGIENCKCIYIMQGNHDVKEETGSALDVLSCMDSKIWLVEEPLLISKNRIADIDETDDRIYLLPYMKPYSVTGYSNIKSYGDEAFHRSYYEKRNGNWDEIKKSIKLVSMHGGDETTGKLFMNADISFLPGIRSNGHIHKQVSVNHLPSAMVTRRDETDKKCFIRKIDLKTWEIMNIEIPLFLNYVQIQYGDDVENCFKSGVHVLPKESLIVDIYGHDDKDLVISEYMEKWGNTKRKDGWPCFYIGEVTPVERKGEAVSDEERDELDISSINIKELFQEFCEHKKVARMIADDLIARIA